MARSRLRTSPHTSLCSWHGDCVFAEGEMSSSLTWPNRKLISLTFVLFRNLGNWQKLSWLDTELSTDKNWKKKKNPIFWLSLVYPYVCLLGSTTKKNRSSWSCTTMPLGIYNAIWTDFYWFSKDGLAPPQKYWIIITRGNRREIMCIFK